MGREKVNTRRRFVKNTTAVGLGISIAPQLIAKSNIMENNAIVISTWRHGVEANKVAWEILNKNGRALDAVEKGVMVTESDPTCTSVGYGGMPDREGNVTLDACIMDHNSNCGSDSFLHEIKHPIAVAKKILTDTPHVMLSGKGAQDFALSNGFLKENLLTPESRQDWKKWLIKSKYKPVINMENHDTISMLILDKNGNLSGGCTTSGAAWKMHGRVGDSPIIGAGLFLDNDIGAAAATGLGEAVIRTAGSAMVVELMRQGKSPLESCKEVVERIYNKHKNSKDIDYLQVGFIAVNKNGNHAGYSLRSGFNYAILDDENGNRMEDSQFKM